MIVDLALCGGRWRRWRGGYITHSRRVLRGAQVLGLDRAERGTAGSTTAWTTICLPDATPPHAARARIKAYATLCPSARAKGQGQVQRERGEFHHRGEIVYQRGSSASCTPHESHSHTRHTEKHAPRKVHMGTPHTQRPHTRYTHRCWCVLGLVREAVSRVLSGRGAVRVCNTFGLGYHARARACTHTPPLREPRRASPAIAQGDRFGRRESAWPSHARPSRARPSRVQAPVGIGSPRTCAARRQRTTHSSGKRPCRLGRR